MVLVTVVMACWAKAQSAILRLFLAIMMFRRLTVRPKPLSSCWEKLTVSADCTAGLKRFAEALELLRVLFQLAVKLVPVSKPRVNELLNCKLWLTRRVRLVPVPEM